MSEAQTTAAAERERSTKHEGGRVVFNESSGRWVWRCSGCGKQAFWDDDWSWYGSWKDADDGRFPWVACSSACARAKPSPPQLSGPERRAKQ